MSAENIEAKSSDRILLHDISNELSTIKLGLYLSQQKETVAEAKKYLVESEKALLKIEDLIQKYRDHLD